MIELVIEVVLYFVLDLLNFWCLSRIVADPGDYTSEDFWKATGIVFLSGGIGGSVGALSHLVSSHYWIEDQTLQILNLIASPLVAGVLLWGWARFKRREIWQGQAFAFFCGFAFLFGYLLVRLSLGTWK